VLRAVRPLFAVVGEMQFEKMVGASGPWTSLDNCSPLQFCTPHWPQVHLRRINFCFWKHNWRYTEPIHIPVCWYILNTPRSVS
jgi:hypothetical protein